MDTSKEYIKMCDYPEIQGQWKPAWGDWFYDPEYDMAEDSIAVLEKSHQMIDWIKEEILFKHPSRWLPRQDQIQEMLGCDDIQVAHHRLLQVFDFWIGRDLKSFEQLWLAFYMSENHQKTWDAKKEKWVKSAKE